MYYPQYHPYFDPMAYEMARRERHGLKRVSNALCWTLLAAMALMTGLLPLCRLYLTAIGYTADSDGAFYGFTPQLFYLATNVAYAVGLVIPAFLYFAVTRMPLRAALPFERVAPLRGAACVLFGTGVCMAANIPANFVVNAEKALGFSGELPSTPVTDDPAVLVLYAVTFAVVPPIVEELLFRGMVLQSLRRFGNGFAVVASALLFGLYHGNFVQMVFAFLAGLAMALITVRTGSLWPTVLVHFINNGLSVALEMVQRYAGEETVERVNSTVMIAVIALGVLAMVYLLIREKRFFRMEPPNPLFRFSDRIGALFANPGGAVMLIFSLISSVAILVGV